MSDAERLREAAALMRERAEVGSPAEYPPPWIVGRTAYDEYESFDVLCHEDGSGLVTEGLDEKAAEHIASWNPAVALAVARMLDEAAAALEHVDLCLDCFHPTCLTVGEAIAVANAYLGGRP